MKLSTLNAEIRGISIDDRHFQSLRFECPKCEDHHWHLVPFSKTEHTKNITFDGKSWPVWQHVSGETIDDITLAPSYHCTAKTCGLHIHIRNGELV